jgi:copper transport protein
MTVARLLATALAAAAAGASAMPSIAWSHAALAATAPATNRVAPHAPQTVALSFSEPVEPRFATISVTDVAGRQLARGAPRRSPAGGRTIERPVRRLRPGWYLAFWRVISADGHPVRGAFTFAVGPGPGPPRQFAVPSLRETAATPGLLAARWAMLLSLMAAVGLVLFRCIVARPIGAAAGGRPLRALTRAAAIAVTASLVLLPAYLLVATAAFAARSPVDVGGVLPLLRISSFGRGLSDLELVLALLGVAAGIAVWLDRTGADRRSVVALLALGSAIACAAAALIVPGLAGHPAQSSPRVTAIALDWAHLAAGSVWLGGLAGLMVLWAAAGAEHRTKVLARVVPRFSRVALGAVLTLVATGAAATVLHLPTFGALWETAYGRSIVLKIGLLSAALLLGAANLLVTTPRLTAAGLRGDAALGTTGARLLRRTVSGEIALVASTVFAAGLLTSLPPPSRALGAAGDALARVGPGPVRHAVTRNGARALVRLEPNVAVRPTRVGLDLSRAGAPVAGATVIARFTMLDMDMGQQAYTLAETSPGSYRRSALALIMVGNWGVTFEVSPRTGRPFSFLLVDRARG